MESASPICLKISIDRGLKNSIFGCAVVLVPCSTIMQGTPLRASWYAISMPTGPPPATSTSVS